MAQFFLLTHFARKQIIKLHRAHLAGAVAWWDWRWWSASLAGSARPPHGSSERWVPAAGQAWGSTAWWRRWCAPCRRTRAPAPAAAPRTAPGPPAYRASPRSRAPSGRPISPLQRILLQHRKMNTLVFEGVGDPKWFVSNPEHRLLLLFRTQLRLRSCMIWVNRSPLQERRAENSHFFPEIMTIIYKL